MQLFLTRTRARQLAVATAALALAIAPALALGWTPATTISTAETSALEPDVAMQALGGGFVTWREGGEGTIRGRGISSDGSLGAILDVSGGATGASNPRVAVAANGTILVVWRTYNGADYLIRATTIVAGVPQSPVNLSAGGEDASEPDVAIDANGNATVAWLRTNGSAVDAQVVQVGPDLSVGTVYDVSTSGQTALHVRVARNADGSGAVVWEEQGGTFVKRIAANGTPTNASQLAVAGEQPDVAVLADGSAEACWFEDAAANLEVTCGIVAVDGTVDGISTMSDPALLEALSLSGDGAASAIVTWLDPTSGPRKVQARRVRTTGSAGSILTISSTGADVAASAPPRIAVAPDGSALAAWVDSDTDLRVRTIDPSDVLGTPVTIAEPSEGATTHAIAWRGERGAVAWRASTSATLRVSIEVPQLPVPPPPTPTPCPTGNDPTITCSTNPGGGLTITGTTGDDVLIGSSSSDVLEGGGGDDQLVGGGGDDTLRGGAGSDELVGGAGTDLLAGGTGLDALDGGDGLDTLLGGPGSDQLLGGVGVDRLVGGVGSDGLKGGSGNDTIVGGIGNDRIAGQGGNDVLSGNAGDDTLLGRGGNDVLIGGLGQDFLQGGDGNDRLFGQLDADALFGDDGIDLLDGGPGADLLDGGAGLDILRPGADT